MTMKTGALLAVALGIAGTAPAQTLPQRGPDFLPRAAAGERATQLNRMLDTDRDGVVRRAEVDAWASGKSLPPGMVEAMFADADADRDGRITLAEQTADALRSFDDADTDHDGRMTGAEREAAELRLAARQGAEGGKPVPR